MTFIKELSNRRSNYAHPDQATTQAKSLDQLSSGIYTEDERFIYELLQNAVDSFDSKSGSLDIKIVAQEDFLVFMHNGEAFSQRDVEGLCDVGNGNKMKDIQKIGYKGIGFKSVFRASNCVYIKSGDYCFKFDKAVWNNYWDSNWKSEYGEKDPDKNYLMPWQIIPIETATPIQIDTTGYNVVTYIHTNNLTELAESVKTLMRTSQFLLFLTAENVRMTYIECGVPKQDIEKQTIENEILLLVNGREESRWLYHMIPNVTIDDEELRLRIAEDQKTPDKLKIDENGKTLSVNTFDIAFAVQVENKGGERIVKTADNPVMYTYLPTSFKFGDEGFPFLVNANFITDAGREQLIKDSEWNKLLISKIPELYLKWVATFSREIKNYYDVLPKKSYGVSDKLRLTYDTAAKSAIETIPFIPSLKTNQLLRGSEAFIDRIGLADILTDRSLLTHINNTYDKKFYGDGCVVANKGYSKLKSYGVFVFDKDCLKSIFDDTQILCNIDVQHDIKFIDFLYQYYNENTQERSDLLTILQSTKFILDDNCTLRAPSDLFIPSTYKEQNALAEDANIMHSSVWNAFQANNSIREWFRSLGVDEMSDISFIKNVICRHGYITRDNTLEVIRFLFEVSKKVNLLEEVGLYTLDNLLFLSQKGTLLQASQLYLSSKYISHCEIDKILDDDIFLSDIYLSDMVDKEELVIFFKRLGVNDNITLKSLRFYKNSEVYELLKDQVKYATQNEYNHSSWTGGDYYMSFSYINVKYIPFISIGNTSHALSKIIWQHILKSPVDLNTVDDYIYGPTGGGYYKRAHLTGHAYLRENFLSWVIKNYQTLPATDGKMYKVTELFKNTPINQEIIGTYLPCFVAEKIDETWWQYLPLKEGLHFDDYLTLLSKISLDIENAKENQRRIEKIYQQLLQYNFENSYGNYQQKLQQWGKTNKILSMGNTFLSPEELSYTNIEGFSLKYQVYTGKIEEKEKLVDLLKLFGVKIYTEENIEALCDIKQEDCKISTRLLSIVSMLALLASEGKDKDYFENKRNELQTKISQTTFYSCKSIQLTFRDSEARADRQTYAVNGQFFFVGDISPAKIEPLLSPLCSFLGIKRKERELFVLITERSYEAIVEFFKEKEYNTDWLESNGTALVPTSDAEVGVELDNGLDHDIQLADSNEAKSLVLAHLESKGFDISNVDRTQSTIHGLKKEGMEYPLVVKSYKDKRYPLRLNPIEWHQLFKPNSMLWLHLGRGVIAPIKAYELFTYQDKLTLSFDTINILMDDRVDKIMQVMRYFNNVHLNLSTLNPDTKRADNLDEYAFHSNNLANSDLDNNTEVQF